MAASDATVHEVIRVIRRHIGDSVLGAILNDLKAVKGNHSFETTIKMLCIEFDRIRSP